MPDEEPDASPLPRAVRRGAVVGGLLAVVCFAVLVSEGSPSGLVRRGPFSSDFFDAQAHALLDGRLDVDPDVAGIEGFVRDGRTHLYFGLVPALLRLPVAAVTDDLDGRLTQVSMLLALAVACWGTARLLWHARVWQRGGRGVTRAEPWIVGAGVAVVGLSSPLLFLAARPVVYHEAELWGAATALVAVDAVLRWWARPSLVRLALAAAAAAVALSSRASVGGGAVAALALTGALALVARRVPWRSAPVLLVAVLLPLGAYAAVNEARFGHPFSIPFEDQVLSGFDPARRATLESTGGTLFGPEFAPTALVTYLRPDGVDLQRLFPWITYREDTAVIGDATFDTIDRSASLPVVAPLLVAFALVGLGAAARRRRCAPWLAVAAGLGSGVVSTVTIAFIAQRYLADFTPLLVVLAALGTWVVADAAARWTPRGRRAVVALATVLAVGGAATTAALALQSQRLFILPSEAARHDLVAFQYDLHDRLSGGRPPGVRAAATVGAPGPRGETVVLDGCRGLYWSDARRWWPLELGDGDGLTLTPALRTSRTELLAGEGWALVADRTGTGVAVSYQHDDGTTRTGPEVPVAAVDGTRLTVLLDRVNSELTVRSEERDLLVGWLVALEGPVRAGPGQRIEPASTPLCDELRARLG